MAYKDFNLAQAKERFHLQEKEALVIGAYQDVQPSAFLLESLKRGLQLSLENEKIRSETLIMPVLLELRENNNGIFGLYSGETLLADKSLGLNGECDFILSGDKTVEISAPIFTLVEAEHNINKRYYGQCVAQMVGAQLFNKTQDREVGPIFGCVASGEDGNLCSWSGKNCSSSGANFI